MTRKRTTKLKTTTQAPSLDRTMPAIHGSTWRNLSAQMLVSLLIMVLIALLAFPLGATTTQLDADAYGFVSRVEGDALLSGLEGNDAIDAEVNHPLLTGDQVTTDSGRVELVLPDGTVIRIGPGSSVVFDSLAGAPDSEVDDGTWILLDQGELQIRTPKTFLGVEDLAVQTSNATLYLAPSGSYRVTAEDSGFTEVVVREGFVEADTRSGSSVARNGEALEISGTTRPFVTTVDAGPADSLELWAGDLDRAANAAVAEDVDSRLAYAAAPLQEAGEWLYVDSRRAWRPYVRADWRPFRHGRWVYTPSGLTWVASAPWGWVTSHYGFWDFVPGYGWLWLPGNVYSPAGVYWYWGPTHVAWIPYGYYNRYSRSGFGFGVYGWAGGDWSYWSDWTFCPTRYFGRRGYDRYWDTGRNLGRERRFGVPRGVVTTDTRGLGPERWGKPSEGLDTLIRRADAQGRSRSLPDVTEFVARRKGADVRIRSGESRTLARKLSARERLQPLPEERNRGRFKTRPVATSRSIDLGGSTRTIRSGSSASTRSLVRSGSVASDRIERGTRIDTGTRTRIRTYDGAGSAGSVRSPGSAGSPGSPGSPGSDTASEKSIAVERGTHRVRSLAGRRSEPGSRSTADRPSARDGASSLDRSVRDTATASERAPVRRVLDRIRAHRETARGSSSATKDSVSRGSSRGSSKAAPPRSSSARSSSSSGSKTRKVSPPSRGSSKRSSASRGTRSSRSKSRPKK